LIRKAERCFLAAATLRIAEFNEPDGVVLAAAMPVRVIMNRCGEGSSVLAEHLLPRRYGLSYSTINFTGELNKKVKSTDPQEVRLTGTAQHSHIRSMEEKGRIDLEYCLNPRRIHVAKIARRE